MESDGGSRDQVHSLCSRCSSEIDSGQAFPDIERKLLLSLSRLINDTYKPSVEESERDRTVRLLSHVRSPSEVTLGNHFVRHATERSEAGESIACRILGKFGQIDRFSGYDSTSGLPKSEKDLVLEERLMVLGLSGFSREFFSLSDMLSYRELTEELTQKLESLSGACRTLGGGKAAVESASKTQSLMIYTFTSLQMTIEQYTNSGPQSIDQAKSLQRHMRKLSDSLSKLQTCLWEYRDEHSSWRWGDFHVVLMRIKIGLSNNACEILYRIISRSFLTSISAKIKRSVDSDRPLTEHILCTTVLPDLIKRFKVLPPFLDSFIDKVTPVVRDAQHAAVSRYLNMTAIAAFFSSVSATTLQFSFNRIDNAISKAVNAFWFLSLIFSVASAISSLLGMSWRQSPMPSPERTLPAWALVWLIKAPMVYLIVAAATFTVGLALFAISSQDRITSAVTVAFALIHILCLLFFTSWFILKSEGLLSDQPPTRSIGPFNWIVSLLPKWSAKRRGIVVVDYELGSAGAVTPLSSGANNHQTDEQEIASLNPHGGDDDKSRDEF